MRPPAPPRPLPFAALLLAAASARAARDRPDVPLADFGGETYGD